VGKLRRSRRFAIKIWHDVSKGGILFPCILEIYYKLYRDSSWKKDETDDKDRSWDCYGTGTTTNTNELFLPTSAPPCILRASILDRPWERFSANNGTPLSSSAAYRGLLLGLGVHGNSSGHNGFANLSVWPLRLSYKGSTKRASWGQSNVYVSEIPFVHIYINAR